MKWENQVFSAKHIPTTSKSKHFIHLPVKSNQIKSNPFLKNMWMQLLLILLALLVGGAAYFGLFNRVSVVEARLDSILFAYKYHKGNTKDMSPFFDHAANLKDSLGQFDPLSLHMWRCLILLILSSLQVGPITPLWVSTLTIPRRLARTTFDLQLALLCQPMLTRASAIKCKNLVSRL
jgi:hypothetical protein